MKGGFTIRSSTEPQKIPSEALYDIRSSFWENFERGPRELTEAEKAELEDLQSQIDQLQQSSGETTTLEFFGKKIPNPIGIASGPAPNFRWIDFFRKLGYGILTYKTMRDRRWQGHGLPNLMHVRGDFDRGFYATDEVTGSITNSLGMPTPVPEAWRSDARRVANSKGDSFFVMSVTATATLGAVESDMLFQFSDLASEGKHAGADAVELNLSCPNVLPGEGGEAYTDASLSGRIVDAVRKSVGSGYPVLVKVGYLDDYREFVEKTYDERIAYVAINSVPGVVRSRQGGDVLFADRGGRAGICGAAIRGEARSAVASLKTAKGSGMKYEIIGLGGVLGAEDAIALMESGATVVESATGALLDPCLALRVRLGLLQAKSSGAAIGKGASGGSVGH